MNTYEELKELKKAKRYDKAISIEMTLIEEAEEESRREKWGVSPAPYLELAKLYLKNKAFFVNISD
ncbi:hypothetical protein DYP60_05470 [Sphaerochaeta halotolerans]|jgi:hypothetical protein|uniref:Uncharacterized protein n=1 Tax=Sphaerochaeta halotolerans TaxID=2293840 RepID=A0A372MI50_9SPIR|nr:hypothetical protein [Sphaerochaeta halotolerans]RFU95078.1 hypothetical protein DYP60_05470 [Sphaerochaeta halotolerans]